MGKPRRMSEKQVFTSYGSKFGVMETKDLVDKKIVITNFVKENNCVVVLPILKNGAVLMGKQYRAAILSTGKKSSRGYTYELPGGHIDNSEDIKKAAARELEEETGYRSNRIRILYRRAMAPYLTTAMEWVCIAEGLSKARKRLDSDEVITNVEMSREEVRKGLKSGKIADALSREALLAYLYLYSH